MKRLLLAGLVAVGALASVQATVPAANANHIDCSTVRCMACPEGQVFSPTPHNCCRCIPA
jgi:hypothetical protein